MMIGEDISPIFAITFDITEKSLDNQKKVSSQFS